VPRGKPHGRIPDGHFLITDRRMGRSRQDRGPPCARVRSSSTRLDFQSAPTWSYRAPSADRNLSSKWPATALIESIDYFWTA